MWIYIVGRDFKSCLQTTFCLLYKWLTQAYRLMYCKIMLTIFIGYSLAGFNLYFRYVSSQIVKTVYEDGINFQFKGSLLSKKYEKYKN